MPKKVPSKNIQVEKVPLTLKFGGSWCIRMDEQWYGGQEQPPLKDQSNFCLRIPVKFDFGDFEVSTFIIPQIEKKKIPAGVKPEDFLFHVALTDFTDIISRNEDWDIFKPWRFSCFSVPKGLKTLPDHNLYVETNVMVNAKMRMSLQEKYVRIRAANDAIDKSRDTLFNCAHRGGIHEGNAPAISQILGFLSQVQSSVSPFSDTYNLLYTKLPRLRTAISELLKRKVRNHTYTIYESDASGIPYLLHREDYWEWPPDTTEVMKAINSIRC